MLTGLSNELTLAIDKSLHALKRDLAKLRAGRATASLLDGIRVDAYGAPTPLAQLAQIHAPEARLLTVKPFDKSQIKAIENALRQSDLALNPQTDGELIRIPFPPLTEERRKELVKLAKKYGEDCKITLRKVRRDTFDRLEKEEESGKDEIDRAKKKVEEVIVEGIKQVDTLLTHKEKDILEI